MKNKLPLLMILPTLLLTSCGNGDIETTTKMISPMTEAQSYELPVTYNDTYFEETNDNYSPYISAASFALTVSTHDKAVVNDLYTSFEYSNIKNSDAYDLTTNKTIGYTIASKETKNYFIVSTSVRGFSYSKEWENNFLINETGNHKGFEDSAYIVYNSLVDYIGQYYTNHEVPLKLWVNGYSRGGAVANALSHLIYKEKRIDVNFSDLYIYTFEAPAPLIKKNAKAYKGVYNIINKADLIPQLLNSTYGFYRAGIDVNIYNPDIDNLVKAFNNNLKLPPFTPNAEKYTDDIAFAEFIINEIYKDRGEEDYPTHTRSDFYQYYQPTIMYAMNLFFSLKKSTTNSIVAYIKEQIDSGNYLALIGIIASGENMAAFLQPYLDEDGIEYNYYELEGHCNVVCYFISSRLMPIISAMFSTIQDTLVRAIDMHMPEVTCALLNKYNKDIIDAKA